MKSSRFDIHLYRGRARNSIPSFDAIPRDNMLLEAGYFTRARGAERVAILTEEKTKMPVELGDVIYVSFTRGNISPVIPRLRPYS